MSLDEMVMLSPFLVKRLSPSNRSMSWGQIFLGEAQLPISAVFRCPHICFASTPVMDGRLSASSGTACETTMVSFELQCFVAVFSNMDWEMFAALVWQSPELTALGLASVYLSCVGFLWAYDVAYGHLRLFFTIDN